MPIAEAPRARGWHTVLKPAPTGARAAINLCCAVAEPIIEPSVQQGGGYGDRTSDSRHHVSGRGIASVTGTVKPRAPSDPASPMEAWLAAALRFVILVIARGSVAQGFLGRRLGFRLDLQFGLGLAKLGEPSLFVSHPLRHLIAAPVRPINLVLSGVRRLGVFEPRIHFGCSSASGPSYTRRSCPTKYPRCVTWKPWRASGIEKRPVTVPASRIVRTPPSRDAISRSRCAFE